MLKIITDSASDLSEELISRYALHVIPTPVVIEEKDYFDGQTIHTKEFYNILDDTSKDVRTYHINPAMFEEAFRPYAERGDSVLYLCFSTGIAGTYNAANIARNNILEDFPDFDLTIFDTKCASAGFRPSGTQAAHHAGTRRFQGTAPGSCGFLSFPYPSCVHRQYVGLPHQGRAPFPLQRRNC